MGLTSLKYDLIKIGINFKEGELMDFGTFILNLFKIIRQFKAFNMLAFINVHGLKCTLKPEFERLYLHVSSNFNQFAFMTIARNLTKINFSKIANVLINFWKNIRRWIKIHSNIGKIVECFSCNKKAEQKKHHKARNHVTLMSLSKKEFSREK